MRFNLDWLLGPRDWCVIRDRDGVAYAARNNTVLRGTGNVLVRSGLREGHAMRLARSLRQKEEDTPRALFK